MNAEATRLPPLRGSSALGLSAYSRTVRANSDASVGGHLRFSSVVPAKAETQNAFEGMS
jgi:hypothetical protein